MIDYLLLLSKNDIITNHILISDIDLDKSNFKNNNYNYISNYKTVNFSYSNFFDNDIFNKLFRDFNKTPFIKKNVNPYKYSLHIINIISVLVMYFSLVKKLIFLGGGYGDSNATDDHIPEAHKMRELAIKNGVNPDDIIVEDKSRNTKENILFALDLLDKSNFDKVMLITSEFHLKRCNALIKKIIPGVSTILVKAPDGIHDRDNWFMSDNIGDNNGKHGSGKSLVENEARILIEGACNGTLENFEVNNRPYNYNLRIINK